VAKVQTGPLVNCIRGKVGNVIFQMTNGIQIARTMPASIQDPQTPRQIAVRDAMKQAVTEWNELSLEERAEWNADARRFCSPSLYRQRMVTDATLVPRDSALYDGHNEAVTEKSREYFYARQQGNEPDPWPATLPEHPPAKKSVSLSPRIIQVFAVKGSSVAAWNPDAPADYDGIVWTHTWKFNEQEGDHAQWWVQPPYPSHRQLANSEDPAGVWPLGGFAGVDAYDGYVWAPGVVLGHDYVPYFPPSVPPTPYAVSRGGEYKFQGRTCQANFRVSPPSAIRSFLLPADLADGFFQLWPSYVDLTPVP
jgi:hypothetical protein